MGLAPAAARGSLASPSTAVAGAAVPSGFGERLVVDGRVARARIRPARDMPMTVEGPKGLRGGRPPWSWHAAWSRLIARFGSIPSSSERSRSRILVALFVNSSTFGSLSPRA